MIKSAHMHFLNFSKQQATCAVTIGNFDGVHLGHQHVIRQLNQLAGDETSCVVLFEPQPREFFAPEQAPARLMRCREKIAALRSLGVQQFLLLRFDQKLAKMLARDFMQTVLLRQLPFQHLLIGDDFRFGHKREGDWNLLQQFSSDYNFNLVKASTLESEGERISSTRIRHCLAAGDCERARALLGDDFSMHGKVIQGQQLGRQWGVPTANIVPHRLHSPLRGVFVVRVQHGSQTHWGVANIGTRPTLLGKRCLLEVHLFDFDETIYGEKLTVSFIHGLRGEQQFKEPAALRAQIDEDIRLAKQYLETA